MHAALLMLLAATPVADVDWQVNELRSWLTSVRGPGHVEDPTAPFPVAGTTELAPGSAGYTEVVTLVSRGCALSTEPAPAEPNGHLWQADLDGDGAAERFFTGGCSPAPYFVALKHRTTGWAVWHEGPGLLLDVKRVGSEIIFEVAGNGYGIERSSWLTLESIDSAGHPLWRRAFRAVSNDGEHQFDSTPSAQGVRCTLRQNAALRFEAKVDDAPQESGMGFDYPGNVLQMLAKESVGLSLGATEKFRLCAFADAKPASNLVKGMRTPSRRTLTPVPTELLVGWVPEVALRH